MSCPSLISRLVSDIKNHCGKKNKVFLFNGYSNLLVNILDILKFYGFVKNYEVIEVDNKKSINVHLKYYNGAPAIMEISTVSKSSCRLYSNAVSIPYFKNRLGMYLLSTSKGIMSDRKARELNVGGELLLKVF